MSNTHPLAVAILEAIGGNAVRDLVALAAVSVPCWQVETQVRENYGAHTWEGKGECPQYWKNKGGSTYMLIGVDESTAYDLITREIERCDEYFEIHAISVTQCKGDTLSWFECAQLEDEGCINFPERRYVAGQGWTWAVPMAEAQAHRRYVLDTVPADQRWW